MGGVFLFAYREMGSLEMRVGERENEKALQKSGGD